MVEAPERIDAPPVTMKPLVSILIPAFNAEKWIAAAIASAIGQTWERKEIVVVDDGSTDKTLAVARRFASPNVTIVTQANMGAAAARNKAFALCRGDYIQWLDADDLLAPDKIERQVDALSRHPGPRILLSSSWGHFIHRSEKSEFRPTPLWCDAAPVEWLVKRMEHNRFMSCAVWLVSRELTESAGPWDTRLSLDDDGEYVSRVIASSEQIHFVAEAKAFYRRRAYSLSYVGRSVEKLESQLLSARLQIRQLRSLEESERVRAACVRYLQNLLICIYPDRMDLVREAEELAAELGGRLKTPQMPLKYAWIQKLFGWTAAKQAALSYNEIKSNILSFWDRMLFRSS